MKRIIMIAAAALLASSTALRAEDQATQDR